MKLNEKIFYCRKKANLSQEALAEKIGVSRQAVSKWETGESEPELSKLRQLAAEFSVSTDWLLSEDEPPQEQGPAPESPAPSVLDSLPGVIGRLARRFGWLAGIYVSLMGAGALVFGLIARLMVTMPLRMFYDDPFFAAELEEMVKNNPIATLGSIFMIAGGVVIVLGIALAIFLKKKLDK